MTYHRIFSIIAMLIFIVVLEKSLSLEHFVNYYSLDTVNKKHKSNVFNNTILLTNNDKHGETINEILNKDNFKNMIRYIEGMKWNLWNHNITDKIEKENQKVLNLLDKKLNKKYYTTNYQINKFRENHHDSNKIIVDIDVSICNDEIPHLYHFNVLYYINLTNKEIQIIICKLIGRIKENTNIDYYNIEGNNDFKYIDFKSDIQKMNYDNLIINEKKENEKVIDILYQEFIKDNEYDDDMKKNIYFKKNHDYIKQMFTKNLIEKDISNRKYKEINSEYENVY